MAAIVAEFDGKVFVPLEPVDAPVGTRVEVIVPPRKATEEEQRAWEEIRKEIEASPPPVGTFDDYLRYKRGEL